MLKHETEPIGIRPYPWWKQLLDIAGATAALLALWPVMLGAAIAIRLTSPGPVVFRQKRGGHGGAPFVMYKFRSMVADAEARRHNLLALNERNGPAFKMKHDPRITPVGRWLRKTSIDELPQLFNVLKGDMSLVGPRPLPLDEEQGYQQWQRRRWDVKPGLTCIWQVTSRDESDFGHWARLDIHYVHHHSVWMDLRLLLQTVPAVLLRKGAH
jgi:lipopolysaccharide/colanic/teichoic acid biosynthesis glycosyltransferase